MQNHYIEQITTLLQQAVDEAREEGRQEARQQVMGLFDSVGPRSKKGSPSFEAARAALKKSKKPGKRTPEEMDALVKQLRTYITKHPGMRIEPMAKEMGLTPKELALPAKKLIAEKAIKTKGNRRATTYYPVG